jgi:hypothetical protein
MAFVMAISEPVPGAGIFRVLQIRPQHKIGMVETRFPLDDLCGPRGARRHRGLHRAAAERAGHAAVHSPDLAPRRGHGYQGAHRRIRGNPRQLRQFHPDRGARGAVAAATLVIARPRERPKQSSVRAAPPFLEVGNGGQQVDSEYEQ